MEDPSVIDSKEDIRLTFDSNLDTNTILNGIKIYNIKTESRELEVDFNIERSEDYQNILCISLKNGVQFSAGEEYKLSINKTLKTSDGKSLENEFITYFALDYNSEQILKGLDNLNIKRSLIICISDIHLGADDSYSETTSNRDALIDFLNLVRVSPNIKELVIAGDLIDEWFVPMGKDTFNGKTQRDFVKVLASNNQSVMDAFQNIINDGIIKVTYVPGNHDILISSEDIEAILPGISQARDVRGLGLYIPEDYPELIIEHGHRYNFYCAPDHSNRSITNTDSILPPGYFFTRMATSSIIQGRPKKDVELPEVTKNGLGDEQYLYYLYYKVWEGLIQNFPINEGIDEPVINTGIDGFTGFYAINDVLPFQNPENKYIDVNLFKGVVETWDERQENNLVPVKIPASDAILKGSLSSHLDEQSEHQFFNNPLSNKRIVIFGHTHDARIITSFNEKHDKNIYVNSGTWIDSKVPTMTFVAFIPPVNKDSNATFINLCQYSKDGNIKKLDSEAITNLK